LGKIALIGAVNGIISVFKYLPVMLRMEYL
jgi:hypothetical protein